MLTCRIPMTPHTLLRPNVTSISKRERAKLPYPLNVQPAPKAKALLKKELRETAGWAAREVAPREPVRGAVVLHYVIVWERGRKRMDFTNVIYSMKGAEDGLMDARWLVDDAQVVGITVEQITGQPDGGYVDITMALAESEAA